MTFETCQHQQSIVYVTFNKKNNKKIRKMNFKCGIKSTCNYHKNEKWFASKLTFAHRYTYTSFFVWYKTIFFISLPPTPERFCTHYVLEMRFVVCLFIDNADKQSQATSQRKCFFSFWFFVFRCFELFLLLFFFLYFSLKFEINTFCQCHSE